MGTVLGAVVVSAITSGADSAGSVAGGTSSSAGGPSATATPSPSARGDVTITVPAQCAEIADDAREATDLLNQAATAARDLDATALADVVRRMQDVRDRLAAKAGACRGTSVSASPSSS